MPVGKPLNRNEWQIAHAIWRYSLVSWGDSGKFIRELQCVANTVNRTLNADFDGDVLNTLGIEMEELSTFFDGFSPKNMLINRTDETIKYDVSALENITLAILSDN